MIVDDADKNENCCIFIQFSGHKAQMNPSIGHALNTHKSTLHFERFLLPEEWKINVSVQFTFLLQHNKQKWSKAYCSWDWNQTYSNHVHADMVWKLFNLVNLKKGTCLSIISHKSTPPKLMSLWKNHMLNYETWKRDLRFFTAAKQQKKIYNSFSHLFQGSHFSTENGQSVISGSPLCL